MHLFYAPDISGVRYTLPEDESGHCVRVLRLGEGDTLHLTDGRGTLYTARIAAASPRRCEVEIVNAVENFGRRNYSLTMAVAPTKSGDRYELFLEKATEIGVDRIVPVICRNSERLGIKRDRLVKVVTGAVKQSLKAYHPVLEEATEFAAFAESCAGGGKFIAHCRPSAGKRLLRDAIVPGTEVTILIGPEGDFSQEEIELARSNGFVEVSLGETRLRVETAAIVACHTVALLNQ